MQFGALKYINKAYSQSFQCYKVIEAAAFDRVKLIFDQMSTTINSNFKKYKNIQLNRTTNIVVVHNIDK